MKPKKVIKRKYTKRKKLMEEKVEAVETPVDTTTGETQVEAVTESSPTTTCEVCGGKGRISDKESCSACNGTGQV